jgi:hypothetical protein
MYTKLQNKITGGETMHSSKKYKTSETVNRVVYGVK